MALYTPEEVAKYLGVCKATVWRWIREGRVKATKLGSRLYKISGEEVKRFLDEGKSK